MPTVPNRSDDLARPRSRKGKEHAYEVTKAKAGQVSIPDPDPDWCNAAKMVWEAAQESGGSQFYENTDWAMLYLVCDQITHLYEQGGRRSPEYLRVIVQTLGSLLFTEGDRRKVRIELERPDEDAGEWQANLVSLFSEEQAN